MKGPANRERSFGLAVGTVLLLIAAYSLWRERVVTAQILGVVGGLLVVLGWLRPSLLVWPSDLWWRLAAVLGWINARVILTVIFLALLLPMSLVWRLIGRDPLGRRASKWAGWSPYPARYRDHRHYTRMF